MAYFDLAFYTYFLIVFSGTAVMNVLYWVCDVIGESDE